MSQIIVIERKVLDELENRVIELQNSVGVYSQGVAAGIVECIIKIKENRITEIPEPKPQIPY